LPHVVFEASAQGIALERSGFGGRPAYHRRDGDRVLASTDLGWVVEASRALGLPLSLDLDQVAAACLLEAGEVGGTRTLFREIDVVAPGTRVTLSPRDRTSSSLALPGTPAPLDRGLPGGDRGRGVARELRERILAAVEGAVRGRGRIGVLTGGGVDSGALLAIGALLAPEVNAFAIDVAAAGDDRPHLATLASALGIEPVRAPPSSGTAPAALEVAGLPLTWPSAIVEAHLLAQARSWGAGCVLAGLGADELFDGDAELAARVLVERGVVAALDAARAYDGSGLLRASRRAFGPWIRRGVPASLRPRLAALRAPPLAWAGPRLVRHLRRSRRPSEGRDPDLLRAFFFSPHLARASELRLQEERLSGVQRVDPYLDASLVAFVCALPAGSLLGRGERRGLFREALIGLLPEPVRIRRDKASFAPIHRALFRSPHVDALRRHASLEALSALGIVEPVAFRRAFGRAVTDDEAAERTGARLHPFLAMEAFARRWS